MNTFTKGVISLGISVFFLSSFFFASTFLNGNLFIKQYGVELIISVLSIVVCCVALIKKDFIGVSLNIIDLFIIFLLLIYTGSLLICKYNLGEQGLPYYYGLLYFISTFIVRNTNITESNILKNSFLMIVPAIIVVHIVIVVLQQIRIFPSLHGYFNNGSTFGNPDILGSYIAVLLPFCFMLKGNRKRKGYIVFLISIFLLIFIQARSAIFALILCGLLWLILNKRISKRLIITSTSITVVLLVLLIFWHPESVVGRFFIWFVSIKMIVAKPLGWGIYAFEKYYPEFQAAYISEAKNLPEMINPEIVHSPFNEFLNIGVTLGIVGLLTYILLVVTVFYSLLKSKSILIYPLFIFMIISLFYFPFKISPLMLLITIFVALSSNYSRVLFQKQLNFFTKYLFLMFLILVSTLLVANTISNYRSYKNWKDAVLLSQKEGRLKESEKLFYSLYPKLKGNGRFLITYSNLRYRQGFRDECLILMKEAEMYFCDITFSIKMAQLYAELGFYKQAAEKFDLAINIAPKNFTARYEKILFFQKTGQQEKAYLASLELLNKPIRESVYADPYIIKSKLKKFVYEYESKLLTNQLSK